MPSSTRSLSTVLLRCLALISLLASASNAMAAGAELEPAGAVEVAQRFNIHSQILQEDRALLVSLPETYDRAGSSQRRYPVIYLLDGPAYFDATIGILHHLSAPSAAVQRIPEAIVVAVRNTKRTRDMTPSRVASGLYSENSGGAAAFRSFIEKELMPAVNARYRTQASATLVGHSLAGLFVVDTFLERPDLFREFIAIDPSLWWDDNLPARKLTKLRPPAPGSRVKLFIAQASPPDEAAGDANSAHRAGISAFREGLGTAHVYALDSHERFEDETHLSVPLVGIYAGLLAVLGK